MRTIARRYEPVQSIGEAIRSFVAASHARRYYGLLKMRIVQVAEIFSQIKARDEKTGGTIEAGLHIHTFHRNSVASTITAVDAPPLPAP